MTSMEPHLQQRGVQDDMMVVGWSEMLDSVGWSVVRCDFDDDKLNLVWEAELNLTKVRWCREMRGRGRII